MPQANVETIKQVYEVWNGEGGILASLQFYDPAVEYVNPATAIEPGTHHGHAGLENVTAGLDAAFAEYDHQLRELISVGDKVLALVTFRARGRDSGVPVEIPEQHVWTLRERKIVRFEWFHDEPAARRAAGL